ncbi:Na+/H+ antiporter NhaC family protein [Parendozoicomonas haliclonae]|uniref:Malate-2H(+)/Na(+)-lactate antiporter n=1 Tax=Parendozoicomonas haliclonae TaxID=1960125 RepID=A0A1X7AEW2_9GAMM|nr:Na+/H+ antiporter NhaC family protein [Parendozoicomonas haliclonae]SMA33795.1 Malate-2H(+)/Na(+)-lactate antiporter [Parendozoicomonas haliclonae]
MDLTSFSQSYLSLLAPAVAIGLAIITRKTIISLVAGILVGSLLLTDFQLTHTAQYLFKSFISVFWSDGGVNTGSVFILLFLICLGIMTSYISVAGGTRAFGEWARKRVKTARGSQLLTVALGIIIFIDDYFNSLAVGNISRPLTDRNRVSRAKLAYLIDSTAAPVCVISPISSWGAYIIALIGSILASHQVTGISPFSAFVEIIPMNLYAVIALAMVFAAAAMDLNIGPMKTHAMRAAQGELYDPRRGEPMGSRDLKDAYMGTVSDLVVPILVLVIATVSALVGTGAQALTEAGLPFSVLGAFENTNVANSLMIGGVIGMACGFLMLMRHKGVSDKVVDATRTGAQSMMGAIYILVLAWVLVDVISNLETGKFLASLVSQSIDAHWLPALMFVIAGIMAFATGTSWGTFGVMLPIAGDMAAATDIAQIMPMMGSVLAGAVFGDHCSPISDTTILSSTGASCHHIDHVVTQLPYCLAVATISFVGYLVMGGTGSVAMALLASAVLFALTLMLFKKISFSGQATSEVVS